MKSVTVLGGGESGIGAALLAKKNSLNVFVSDYGKITDQFKEELRKNSIPFEEEGHSIERIETTEVIVKSPGIPEKAAIVQHFRKGAKEIISEIEFAFRFYEGKIVGITGSNGKTTTTSLIYHLLQDYPGKVGLGGNIGLSFSRLLSSGEKYNWVVLELSSFQLDDIKSFSADIGILLNITPDHLDRYDYEMEKYAEAKWKLVASVKDDGHTLINVNDSWTLEFLKKSQLHCQLHRLSFVNPDLNQLSDAYEPVNIEDNLILKGIHNLFNAQIAIRVGQILGIKAKTLENRLRKFEAIAHRLETVSVVNGVEFINDSKATNIDSVVVALKAMDRPVIWIAGGTDKGNDYALLQELVKDKVKAIVCLTKDDRKLRSAFENIVIRISTTEDTNEAVRMSVEMAHEGDIVLLSPACASFDLFNNYEHRGEAFKNAVRRIG